MRFKINHGFIFLFLICMIILSCTKSEKKSKDLIIFYAPCFSPVIDAVREKAQKELNIQLRTEVSGSQVVCRKVTELGRECDLMMLADNTLFKTIASSHCSWRIDFAHDEVVLGIGTRAKYVDEAEKNWVPVLLNDEVRLGRVDENLGPIGYRTLLVWKLKEQFDNPGIFERLFKKAEKPVEHVGHLAAILKTGEIDYGFLYRTTCVDNDIRFIPLDEEINLGTSNHDYSKAKVSFRSLEAGKERIITIAGEPITYSLSIPLNAPNKDHAIKFTQYLLNIQKDLFIQHGFTPFGPAFYGKKDQFSSFAEFAQYSGDF